MKIFGVTIFDLTNFCYKIQISNYPSVFPVCIKTTHLGRFFNTYTGSGEKSFCVEINLPGIGMFLIPGSPSSLAKRIEEHVKLNVERAAVGLNKIHYHGYANKKPIVLYRLHLHHRIPIGAIQLVLIRNRIDTKVQLLKLWKEELILED